MPEDGAPERR